MRLFSKSAAAIPLPPHAHQRPPRAPDAPALGPAQLAWLRRTMPTSFAAAEQAARLAGRAAALTETPAPADTSSAPDPLATPLLALRGTGKPLDALALVSAARAVLEAHDAGRNRAVPLEALRAALAGWEG